ncbi:MAG: hypothetical protein Q8S43_11310 [Actinomycetota bacterium]|nr:MAG: hypothetical protein FD171_920 [Actinomycetota bacterium]MDP3631521.1 hypothetical protein [Actinomycetota bacterium]
MDALTIEADHQISFGESYALLYAFTLAFYVPAIVALRTQPYYSYTPAYLAFMTLPPILAMVTLVLVHDPSARWLRTIGKALLFAVTSMIGGAALFLSTSFLLVFLGPAFEARNFGPLQVGIGVIMVLFVLPLVLTAVSLVRRFRVGALAEAAVVLCAIAAFTWIGWVILSQQGKLSDLLRKDQVSYLVGGVLWYIPAYSLVGTLVRSSGVL